MSELRPKDPNDEIRKMFEAAREHDRATAPEFCGPQSPPERAGRRSGMRPWGFGLSAAASAVALTVAMIVLRSSVDHPGELESAVVMPPLAAAEPALPPSAQPVVELPAAPVPKPRNVRTAILAPAGPPSPPPPPPPTQSSRIIAEQAVADLVRTTHSTTFSADYIQDLPVQGRSYQNVVTLAPGVQDPDGDGAPNVHGGRERKFSGIVGGLAGGVVGGSARTLSERSSAAETGTESYDTFSENDFHAPRDEPLSTFSIDVDTASYSNVRRFLIQGQRPPRDAVRIEELINYFPYDYPPPGRGAPFSATIETAGCPWNAEHRLVRIGLKGREGSRSAAGGSNLVFLIDVSGSMQPPNKLPLLKQALGLLVDQLEASDTVTMVVYAGASGLALPPTSGSHRNEIQEALARLDAGGSTNGGAGIELAYRLAREHFIQGGVNRVILATDGDFNVGTTDRGELLARIEDDARRGIFLTALGFGMGNYKDEMLETLADKGNGNYAYIDGIEEARKVLVEQIGGTLVTIAKDVKIQVEFNPAEVGAYRLVGYENRMLHKEDFNDDRKDAGEIGAGHTVTALYEVAPPRATPGAAAVDPLTYQTPAGLAGAARSGELATLKIRYKDPEGHTSRLLSFPVIDGGADLGAASADFKFAAAVAEFGLLLRDSSHKGQASFEQARQLALQGFGSDEAGYRRGFVELTERAMGLDGGRP